MKKIEQIISDIQTYKEDHPEVVITDFMIKEIIEENMDNLIKEIEEEL